MKRRSDAQPQSGLTDDAFLGGRLRILQPMVGLRAGLDAVMLAAAVPAKAGNRVVELGTGVGVASLCLAARVPHLKLTAIEIDPGLCVLAAANAVRNGFDGAMDVIEADIARLPKSLARQSFDHALFNPPFGTAGQGTPPPEPRKALAVKGAPGLFDMWVNRALALLKPKGTLTLIHRADALAEILRPLGRKVGAIEVIPLWPRAGEPASRVIVRARKDSRAPLILRAGLVLHDPIKGFTPEADRILRLGEGLAT